MMLLWVILPNQSQFAPLQRLTISVLPEAEKCDPVACFMFAVGSLKLKMVGLKGVESVRSNWNSSLAK